MGDKMKKGFLLLLAVVLSACTASPSVEMTDPTMMPESTPTVEPQIEEETVPVVLLTKDLPSREDMFNTIFQVGSETVGFYLIEEPDLLTLDVNWWGSTEDKIQVATDQLMFLNGHTYEIKFTVTSDLADTMRISWGDESGTFDTSTVKIHSGSEHVLKVHHQRNDTYTGWISVELMKSKEATETQIQFSHFRMVDLDESNVSVRVNQHGYLPESQKIAVFQANAGEVFDVVCADTQEIVYTGAIVNRAFNEETGEVNSIGDFSAVTKPGSYYIRSAIHGQSRIFKIAPDLYHNLLNSSLHMITLQRCGEALSKEVADVFAHENCHDASSIVYPDHEARDFSGGWHDAGDYGRYTLTTVKTLNDLLLTYWLYPNVLDDASSSPNSGNHQADVLDEAKVGIDWLKKMQMDWGPVYTAAVSKGFAGFVMPDKDDQSIYILEEESTSTAAVSGSFALASIVLHDVDVSLSKDLLERAEKAYQAFEKSEWIEDKKNPWDVEAGDYSNTSVLDEWYFAAAALYTATHDEIYLEDLKTLILKQDVSLTGLSYNDMGGYGSYLLLQDEVFKNNELYQAVYEDFMGQASGILGMQHKNGYHVAVNGYYWGGNMFVANNAMHLLLANALQSDTLLIDGAQQQLSYLLGCNSLDMSFITGFGQKYPMDIHHRMTESLNQQMKGALVGGPDNTIDSTRPSAKRYWDDSELYSTNEVTIYYNSPLVFITAGIMATQNGE